MIDRVKNFFQKKCKTCFFYQNNDCVLYRIRTLPCEMKVKKIKGIDNIEFYVNMVNSKKISIRALYFSLSALIISMIGLVINYIRLMK